MGGEAVWYCLHFIFFNVIRLYHDRPLSTDGGLWRAGSGWPVVFVVQCDIIFLRYCILVRVVFYQV